MVFNTICLCLINNFLAFESFPTILTTPNCLFSITLVCKYKLFLLFWMKIQNCFHFRVFVNFRTSVRYLQRQIYFLLIKNRLKFLGYSVDKRPNLRRNVLQLTNSINQPSYQWGLPLLKLWWLIGKPLYLFTAFFI